jgi:ATP/maltotriose-dependent transcriptional regulator MalT
LAREVVDAANRLAAQAGGVAALDRLARRAYLDALQLEYEVAVQEDDVQWMLRSAEARAGAARGFDLEAHLAASLAACVALSWSGRVGDAARRLRAAWNEAHRQVFPRLAIDVGFWLARAHHVLGELAEAERLARDASELAARAGDLPRARHRIAKVACDIALDRGEPWAALDRFKEETAAEPNEHQRIVWHGDLARWSARLEGPRAANAVREQVAAGRACAERVGCRRCGADLLLRSAEAFARIGDLDEARRTLGAWDRRPQEDELNRLTRAHVAALAEAKAEARAAALDAVRRAAEDGPFRLVALWVQFDLGLALAAAGSESAPRELERAATTARALGATTVDELAGRALRSLGVRTWRRAAKGDPLTERELAVARCVANGSTNREIAQLLFLSPKTVERHLSNVFRKVGVRNRAELAARVRAPAHRDEADAS